MPSVIERIVAVLTGRLAVFIAVLAVAVFSPIGALQTISLDHSTPKPPGETDPGEEPPREELSLGLDLHGQREDGAREEGSYTAAGRG